MQSLPVPSAVTLPSSGTPAQPPPPGSRIFEEALRDFKKGLSKKELAQFQNVDFKDVEDTIKNIERDQKMKKKMQNIERIKPFLHAMRQYGQIVEVFLNISNIVAYIWVSFPMCFTLTMCTCDLLENSIIQGPIKLLLMVGTLYTSTALVYAILS